MQLRKESPKNFRLAGVLTSFLHPTIQMKFIYSFSFNKQCVMIFMRNKQQQNQFKTVLAFFDSYQRNYVYLIFTYIHCLQVAITTPEGGS